MNFSIIVATDLNNGIGKSSNLLYKSKNDMQYFKTVTTSVKNNKKQNAVIMGRLTWESIPTKFKPLPERKNVIISHNNYNLLCEKYKNNNSILIFKNLISALEHLKKDNSIEDIFIIGGERLYRESLDNDYCQYIYQTIINDSSDADTFFPTIDSNKFELIREESEINKDCIRINDSKKLDLKLNFKLFKSLKRYS